MIILGLDPGTAILGWGVIDTGQRHDVSTASCISYGAITTDKGMTDSLRLVALANGLELLLTEYQPELACVEKLFFTKNVSTGMTVSQARGVILLTLQQQQIPYTEYNPMQVKQSLTGYGKADKKQMQEMVKRLLRLEVIPKPDDAADALAIALTAAAYC